MAIFQKAERRKAKLRLALCGPSGSGKTYSALKIAKGMGGKIALIDTENGSGLLYSNICDYDAAEIAPPFSVDKYIGAIKEAEKAGYEILIIDSLTHAWAGQGGLLEEVDKRKSGANSFAAWRNVTPMHNALVDTILQSKMHVIVTMRSKTAYEIEKDERGKAVPVKKGMAPIQRDGLEYEFTVVLDMDNKSHAAEAGKDRTGIFDGKFFVPDENTGAQLIQWLDTGSEVAPQYYQGQVQQQWNGGYQQGYEQQPVQYQQSQVPIYGFIAFESEFILAWNNGGWDPNGITNYIQTRFNRPPSQLTYDECNYLTIEFEGYAKDKLGGQQ